MRRAEDQSKLKQLLLDRRFMLLAFLFLLLLILLIVLVLRLPQELLPSEARKPKAQQLLKSEFQRELSPKQVQEAQLFKDRLLFLTRNELSLEDYQSNIIYNRVVNWEKAAATVAGDYLFAGDRLSPEFFVFQRDGLVFAGTLDGAFAGASASPKGDIFALIDEQKQGNPVVQIYNREGQRRCTLSFAQSGYPLVLQFTDDGQYLDILILNSSGSRLKSLIKRYDSNGTQVAQRAIDAPPELFVALGHDANAMPLVHSHHLLQLYDFQQNLPLAQYEFLTIAAACSYKDKLIVLGSKLYDGNNSLFLLQPNGESEELVPNLPQDIISLELGSKLILGNGSSFRVFDLNKLSISETYEMDLDILQLAQVTDKEMAVLGSKGARIVPVP